MSYNKYVIVGSSHAGLSALEAIRVRDPDGSVTMVTREDHLPYSPTILPYVVSGYVGPERVFLRSEHDLKRLGVDFRRKAKAVAVDSANHYVTLESGERLEYGKLLLATGAAPMLPPLSKYSFIILSFTTPSSLFSKFVINIISIPFLINFLIASRTVLFSFKKSE